MPAVIDREWFERIGLSANLATRNIHALRFLRLADDEHRPTELAERLRIAPADGFARSVAIVVRTAYADVWAICDPALDSRGRIDDAFRHADPPAQRSRMVACFMGLCELAEIRLPLRPKGRPAPPPGPRVSRVNPIRVEPAAPVAGEQVKTDPAPSKKAALDYLLAKFPDFDPAWPDAIKDKWFEAFARLRTDVLR